MTKKFFRRIGAPHFCAGLSNSFRRHCRVYCISLHPDCQTDKWTPSSKDGFSRVPLISCRRIWWAPAGWCRMCRPNTPW